MKFTFELEKDETLPFLNTLLQRKDDRSLDITVYRKPTHTDQYLHFHSHHPSHVKKGLVRCLHRRARSITLSQEKLQKENGHLTATLKRNGYPAHFICTFSSPLPPQNIQEAGSEEVDKPKMVVIPYVASIG